MAIHDEQDKKLRARAIVQKVVLEGKTQKQAAKELGISHDTVARGLAYARKANLYVEFEQRAYEELLPAAFQAVKLELEDGNGDLGLKILQGLNIIKTSNQKSKAEQEDEEGLYGEIARLRAGSTIDVTPQITGPTIESPVESAGDPGNDVWGSISITDPDGTTVIEAIEGETGPEHANQSTEEQS